jgi:hypothetical protein
METLRTNFPLHCGQVHNDGHLCLLSTVENQAPAKELGVFLTLHTINQSCSTSTASIAE